MPETKLTAISLFASAEGRLLLIGLTLTGLMLLAFAIGWQLFPERILAYGAMTGLNLAFGRAAGLSLGYASGFGHAQVIPFMLLVETIKVLVLYPLFVLSWRRLIQLPRLQAFFNRMHRAAESGEKTVHKFGIVGLFVFVLAPVWATGPVVGAIIGFLIGLRTGMNLAVVLSATYVAIGMWGLLLNELSAWAATVHRFAPYALLLAIVLIAVAMRWLLRRR